MHCNQVFYLKMRGDYYRSELNDTHTLWFKPNPWLLPQLLVMTAQWLRLPRRIYRWTTKRCDWSCKNSVLSWRARLGENCRAVRWICSCSTRVLSDSQWALADNWLGGLVKPYESLASHVFPLVFRCIVFMVPKPKGQKGFHHHQDLPMHQGSSKFCFLFCWRIVLRCHVYNISEAWPSYEPFKAFTQVVDPGPSTSNALRSKTQAKRNRWKGKCLLLWTSLHVSETKMFWCTNRSIHRAPMSLNHECNL